MKADTQEFCVRYFWHSKNKSYLAYLAHTPFTPRFVFFFLFLRLLRQKFCVGNHGNAIVGFVWVRSTRQARTCPAPAPKATELEADTARTAIFIVVLCRSIVVLYFPAGTRSRAGAPMSQPSGSRRSHTRGKVPRGL